MTFEEVQNLLRACGYPESTVVLDAETYTNKNYSLNKLSTYEYVSDDRFELLGWAIKQNENDTRFSADLPEIDWKNTTVIVFNAPFDALILAWHYNLYPPFILDVLDLARHLEPRWKNSLEALCKRYDLPPKGEIKQFLGLHRSEFTEQQRKDLAVYARNDAERTFDLLLRLLPKLSNPKFELQVMEYTRNLFLRPILCLNMNEAATLKSQMEEEVARILGKVDWILGYAD